MKTIEIKHNNDVNLAYVNESGTKLLTASDDHTVCVWQPYKFTRNQLFLYNLLYTWIMVKKPGKKLSGPRRQNPACQTSCGKRKPNKPAPKPV